MDIPGYDVQDAVPWNSDSGKNISPPRKAVELTWSTDLLDDPADKHSITDPTIGWSPGT